MFESGNPNHCMQTKVWDQTKLQRPICHVFQGQGTSAWPLATHFLWKGLISASSLYIWTTVMLRVVRIPEIPQAQEKYFQCPFHGHGRVHVLCSQAIFFSCTHSWDYPLTLLMPLAEFLPMKQIGMLYRSSPTSWNISFSVFLIS